MTLFPGTDFPDVLPATDDAIDLANLAGDDIIFGRDGNDIIRAYDGNDSVNGGLDNDRLFGNRGQDTLDGDDGNDELQGGQQDDLLWGGNGNDLLFGNMDQDGVFGGSGNDTLYGGKGVDSLLGEAGDDELAGDLGADFLWGGPGKDTFVIGRRRDSFATEGGAISTGGATIDEADTIEDFELLGGDRLKLIGGLRLAELNLFDGTGPHANSAILQDKTTGQFLARVKGATASALLNTPGIFLEADLETGVVPPQGALEFSTAIVQGSEGGAAQITVSRNMNFAQGAVSVDVSIIGGTATAGVDYVPFNQTLILGPGQIAQTFRVNLVDDGGVDTGEVIRMMLSNPTGGAIVGPQASAVLAIVDRLPRSTPDPAPSDPAPSGLAAPKLLNAEVVVANQAGAIGTLVSPSASGYKILEILDRNGAVIDPTAVTVDVFGNLNLSPSGAAMLTNLSATVAPVLNVQVVAIDAQGNTASPRTTLPIYGDLAAAAPNPLLNNGRDDSANGAQDTLGIQAGTRVGSGGGVTLAQSNLTLSALGPGAGLRGPLTLAGQNLTVKNLTLDNVNITAPQATLANNVIQASGTTDAIAIDPLTGPLVGVTLRNNTIIADRGSGIEFGGTAPITSIQVTGNTVSVTGRPASDGALTLSNRVAVEGVIHSNVLSAMGFDPSQAIGALTLTASALPAGAITAPQLSSNVFSDANGVNVVGNVSIADFRPAGALPLTVVGNFSAIAVPLAGNSAIPGTTGSNGNLALAGPNTIIGVA